MKRLTAHDKILYIRQNPTTLLIRFHIAATSICCRREKYYAYSKYDTIIFCSYNIIVTPNFSASCVKSIILKKQ